MINTLPSYITTAMLTTDAPNGTQKDHTMLMQCFDVSKIRLPHTLHFPERWALCASRDNNHNKPQGEKGKRQGRFQRLHQSVGPNNYCIAIDFLPCRTEFCLDMQRRLARLTLRTHHIQSETIQVNLNVAGGDHSTDNQSAPLFLQRLIPAVITQRRADCLLACVPPHYRPPTAQSFSYLSFCDLFVSACSPLPSAHVLQ